MGIDRGTRGASLSGLFSCVAFVLVSLLGGCGSSTPTMGQYNVEISLSPELAANPPALTVDLVGATDAQMSELAAYDPKRWFSGGDVHRSSATKSTVTFGPGDTGFKVVRKDDKGTNQANWKTWKDAKSSWLFVFVNLPKDGSTRKLQLPLDKKRWEGDTIRLEVREGGVISTNGPKPEPVK